MAVASSSLDRGPASSARALLLRAGGGAAVAGFIFFALHLAFGLGGPGLDEFTDKWLYDGLELLAAAGCLLRALWVRSERGAWVVLGLGVLVFAAGDVVFDFYYGGNPPGVSLADVGYLAFYPASYVGVTLLAALWPASLLLVAGSAWQQSTRRMRIELEGRPLAATPIVCGLAATGVFVADRFQDVNALAIALAAATVATVLLRT